MFASLLPFRFARRRIVEALTLASLGLSAGTAIRAGAQEIPASRPAPSIASLADSIATQGDSTRAYAMLDSAVRANRRDGAAWYQFGLLNWNFAKSKRRPGFIGDPQVIRWLRAADTALRLATQLAPDSARYWLSLSKFNLTSGVATMQFAAAGEVDNALTAATKAGDRQLIGVAANEAGLATWRRYEPTANRALLSDGQPKIDGSFFANIPRDKMKGALENFVHRMEPPTGTRDYNTAFEHFRTAVEADPTALRYSRHLFMVLGERKRWNEMLDLADRRARAYPLDAQAQLARGLALHRLNDDKRAQVAFDSALVLMDDDERKRLTRFSRILRPKPTKATRGTIADTASFAKLPEAQQRGLEEMYWYMNDPLALTNENELRLEFLSRVVWADFRWTSDEAELLGADTDRGDIHVRYGPPDLEMTVPGNTNVQATANSGVTLVWAYNNGLVFFFDLPPGYNTARFAFIDRDNVDQIKSQMPTSWANIAATRMIDTIPVRVVRFRAGHDSTDAVVATRIPVDSLVRGLDVVRAPVDIDIRVFDNFVRVKGVESTQEGIRPDSANTPLSRQWRRRLGPGINVLRIEALQADSRRAARAMVRINPEATTGFGMSDVLLGDPPVVRDGGAPKRWSDLTMEPGVGHYARGSSVGLVWEMYDVSARNGSSTYRVAIQVERTDRSAVGSFAARLVDGLGRSVGRTQVSRDKLTISFERTAAASETLVEFFALNLSDQAPGTYRLKVDVTDTGNGKKTSRETEFTIR